MHEALPARLYRRFLSEDKPPSIGLELKALLEFVHP
jgi:hypothetical protein